MRSPMRRPFAPVRTSPRASSARRIRSQDLSSVSSVKAATTAGTGCGSCVPLLGELLACEMKRAGKKVSRDLCEHFPHSRQEAVPPPPGAGSPQLRRAHRQARSRPRLRGLQAAVASMLSSTSNEHVLEDRHLGLQDTNDRFLANIQRDGSYSVVPRGPRWRDHPRAAHRSRVDRPEARPLLEDHRRAAGGPLRAHGSSSCRMVWAGPHRRRLRVRATPTARPCAR
jgi:bacterioferritin-associated ferredoxin